MKSTFTVSIDSKTLQEFFDTTYKQGVVKSAIIQKLVLEYLENGLRNNPQPQGRKQHKGLVK
jgi:hypothetical protein